MKQKTNNLDTFQLLFLIKGILNLVMMIIPAMYIIFGTYFESIMKNDPLMRNAPFNPSNIFVIVGIIGVVLLLILGILNLLISINIKNKKNYNFIFVGAIIGAITGILGILLCIFSLIELSKPQVKAIFKPSENKSNLNDNFSSTTT